jgi:exopolyphosphatase/guanosine-5'-triphosphate,3'-diphosphate pyrophosphatase
MKTTVIDIGTNTILMLIGDLDHPVSQILTHLDIQRIPRLGKGVDSNRNITDESVNKAVKILNEYKEISKDNLSNKITAVATSFIRDANNKYEFLERIKKENGIDVEILSGEHEARWTFWGCAYDFLDDTKGTPAAVIDIGGGSTEITATPSLPVNITRKTLIEQKIFSSSLDIGAVRIKERFSLNQPPLKEDLAEAEKFVNDNLDKIKYDFTGASLIGGAGTVTTLAAVYKKLNEYDRDAVDKLVLQLDDIKKMQHSFYKSSMNKLHTLGNFMEGRADVMVTGTMILICFMEKFGFSEIHVSSKGLRYGIFLRDTITRKLS